MNHLDQDDLPDVDVWMMHEDLSRVAQMPLPEGYSMRFYCEGDVATWVDVQNSADEFFTATADTFKNSLSGPADYLAERVMFLVDPSGRDIGSITAWESSKLTGESLGQVHWVAIRPESQGMGLAKPMLAKTCQLLTELGHSAAFLSTNTRRVPALNLYLGMGFKPYQVGENEAHAWSQIKHLLKIDPFES